MIKQRPLKTSFSFYNFINTEVQLEKLIIFYSEDPLFKIIEFNLNATIDCMNQ